jgi:ABC-type Fe3+/spermidine/putrescine transport system ATPase subunit
MATANKTPVLTVEHVTMRFGGLTAVSDLSFEANRNEITALIGPNGAGKTTVFNCITGFYKPTEGKIALRHADGTEFLLERMDDFRIAQNAKVARTFQNIRLFSGMTVLENLMVAQHNKLMVASGYTVAGVLGSGHYRRAEKDAIELAKAWLEKVRLSTVRLSGCTASFVSPDGLMLTNHHCVQGCLAQLSSKERDLHKNGFLASGREQELRCPTQNADILMEIPRQRPQPGDDR